MINKRQTFTARKGGSVTITKEEKAKTTTKSQVKNDVKEKASNTSKKRSNV